MRRFYFNVRGRSVVYEDYQGEYLAGRPEAWDWAIRDAQLLLDQGVIDGDPHEYWIEILDERRRPVATVPLARLSKN
jgi:hypothetical protein